MVTPAPTQITMQGEHDRGTYFHTPMQNVTSPSAAKAGSGSVSMLPDIQGMKNNTGLASQLTMNDGIIDANSV